MNQPSILRNRVKAHLLANIKNGSLVHGKTINLAKLARELKISVTPIREALSQLEQSRIVQAIPNRGFVIPELTLAEAKDLYNTMAQLAVMALEDTDFKKHTLEALEESLLQLQQAHTPVGRIQHRIQFHQLLMQDNANKILAALIADLEARIFFYEQLYISDASFYEQVDNQNESILKAIKENNQPTAALILKMNWLNVSEHIKTKLLRNEKIAFETIDP